MRRGGLMLCVAAALMMFAGSVMAQAADPKPAPATEVNAAPAPDAAQPVVVKVGAYLLSLGKLDMSTGTYTSDFYLWMKSDKPFTQSYEFMNGRAGSTDQIQDNATEKWWRIQANLTVPVDLRRYPFDSQKLQIVLEDKKLTLPNFRYASLDNESGIDPSIEFAGWEIAGPPKATVTEHSYPWGEKYSQYVLTVDIQRVKWNAFLKTLLPVVFIMLVVMSSFILGPDKASTRLAMVSSGLVACVMFHLSISASIPPVGYLTFADKFMVLTYFILLASFFQNAWLMVLMDKHKDEKKAMRVHKATEWSVFFIVPALYVALFLTLLI